MGRLYSYGKDQLLYTLNYFLGNGIEWKIELLGMYPFICDREREINGKRKLKGFL